MKDLVYTLSQETLYYRFMAPMKQFSEKQIQDFVYIDHRSEVAIVGTLPEAHGEEIIAVGRYFLNPKTNRAEVAFVRPRYLAESRHRPFPAEVPQRHCQTPRHQRLHGRSAPRRQADAGGL